MFKNTNGVTLCQNSVFFCKSVGMSKMRFSQRKLHFLFLSVYVGARETEKIKQTKNGKRPNNPITIVFLRWSSKNAKKGILRKIV